MRSIISSEVQYKFSIILVISLIVIDVMIANFFDLLDSTFGGESIMGAAIFTLIAVALYAPLLSLLRYAGKVSESVRAKDSSFDKLHKIVNISQLVFAGIIAILISLMFSVSQYYIAFLVAATILSQGLTATILGGFWFRMSSWYKSSQRNKMLLLYGLAGLMVAISSAVNAFTYSAILLSDDRQWRGPMSNVSLVEIRVEALPFIDSLLMIGFLPLIAAYVLAWGGSVMVLKHQGKQFGRLRLWSLLAAPLVIYVIAISQDFFTVSPAFVQLSEEQQYFFRAVHKAVDIAAGILFGVAFLTIARTARRHLDRPDIANYLIMSALGVMMIINILPSSIYYATYPPFGLVSTSVILLASYFLSLGFYSSALSVSTDARLRQSIRKIAADETSLVGSIGTAMMEREMEKRVATIVSRQRKALEEQTGIQPAVDEVELKQYLHDVLEEISKKRATKA